MRYRIGDRVVITNPLSMASGESGKIVGYNALTSLYKILVDIGIDGEELEYREGEIALSLAPSVLSSKENKKEISIDGKEKLFSPGGGCKTDGDKLMLQLIEPEFLERMAEILTAGAKKYGDYNWRGLDKSRVVGSLMRHLNSYRKGEVMDNQYPFGSNLAAIAVNAMFLDWMENNQTEDGFVEDSL